MREAIVLGIIVFICVFIVVWADYQDTPEEAAEKKRLAQLEADLLSDQEAHEELFFDQIEEYRSDFPDASESSTEADRR